MLRIRQYSWLLLLGTHEGIVTWGIVVDSVYKILILGNLIWYRVGPNFNNKSATNWGRINLTSSINALKIIWSCVDSVDIIQVVNKNC